jgi:integrase
MSHSLSISALFNEFENWAPVQQTTKRKCKFAIKKLIAFLGDILIADVTSQLCGRFQAYLSTMMPDSSVESYFAAASQVFAWSVQQKHLIENPFKGVKKIRHTGFEVRTYKADEIDDLLEAVTAIAWKDRTAALRWTGFFLLGLHGLREGEIWNLRWDDIDLDAGLILIQYRPDKFGEYWKWQSKSKAEGEVPMSQELWECLSRMKVVIDWQYPFLKKCTYERLREQVGKLSEFQRKAPYNNFHRELRKIMKVANRNRAIKGRKKITGDFHQLRKTAGTHLAAQVPIHFTKALLRQSSIKTTTAYYVAVDKQLCRQQGRDAFNAYWAR